MIFRENDFLKTYNEITKLWEASATTLGSGVDTGVGLDPEAKRDSEIIINGKRYSFATSFLSKDDFYGQFAGRRVSGIYIMRRKADNAEFKPMYYVGKSVDLAHRIKTHFRAPENDSKRLHTAIRKYTADAFDIAVVEFTSPEKLDAAEDYWINELKTLDSTIGYNLKAGGEGGASKRIVTKDMHDNIIQDLANTTLTETEIATKYGLKSAKTITLINQGCYWLSSSDYQYPIRDAATIKRISQEATRKKDLRTPWVHLYRMRTKKVLDPATDEYLGKFLGAGKAAEAVYDLFREENELSSEDLEKTKILASIQRSFNRRNRTWFEFYIKVD